MPITTSRPGIFEGARHNRTEWYIVDPTADVETVAFAWISRNAPTNQSFIRRIIAGTAGWTVFLVLAIGAPIAALMLAPEGFAGLAVATGVVGLACGIGAAVAVHGWIIPAVDPGVPGPVEVVPLEPEVVAWAGDLTPHVDVWRLNSTLYRVRNIRTAYDYWGVDYDFEAARRPDRIIDELIEPILRSEFEAERTRLTTVAEELDFTIPADAVRDPEPLSIHSEE